MLDPKRGRGIFGRFFRARRAGRFRRGARALGQQARRRLGRGGVEDEGVGDALFRRRRRGRRR